MPDPSPVRHHLTTNVARFLEQKLQGLRPRGHRSVEMHPAERQPFLGSTAIRGVVNIQVGFGLNIPDEVLAKPQAEQEAILRAELERLYGHIVDEVRRKLGDGAPGPSPADGFRDFLGREPRDVAITEELRQRALRDLADLWPKEPLKQRMLGDLPGAAIRELAEAEPVDEIPIPPMPFDQEARHAGD